MTGMVRMTEEEATKPEAAATTVMELLKWGLEVAGKRLSLRAVTWPVQVLMPRLLVQLAGL
jgi:hypothetical protein